jgi:hypothetical protein
LLVIEVKTDLGVRNSAYLIDMLSEISHVNICSESDSYVWSLANDGVFSVGVTRPHIDDRLLPSLNHPTLWDKFIVKLTFSYGD